MTHGRHKLWSMAALVLAIGLALLGPARAFAQTDCSDPSSCSDSGGSGSGDPSNGGSGAGSSGSDGGTGGRGVEEPDPSPQPTVQVVPVAPAPARPRSAGASSKNTTEPATTTGSGGPATDRGGTAATDDQVNAWAQHFHTTPDEVKSWFSPYSTNDTIGGEGSLRTVHAGEEVTISDNGAIDDGAAAAGFMDTSAGNTIELSLHSNGVPLGEAMTDAQGRFTATVRIPASTPLGRHFIVALAPNTKQGIVAFVFPVNVVTGEPVFDVPAAAQPTTTRHSGPWVTLEVILGTALLAALLVVRVRRGVTVRS